MLIKPLRHDWRIPRDWKRPWLDAPGFFIPGCFCCAGGGGATQQYYVFGGTSAIAILNTNYQWTSGWATKATLPAATYELVASTPTTTGSAYIYGGLNSSSIRINTSSSYTPDTWSSNTALPSPARNNQTACAISSKSYCWGGGWNTSPFWTAQNDEMTPGSPSTWANKTSVTAALEVCVGAPISTKGYNICGTLSSGANVTTNYEYDPSGNSWATKTAFPATAKGSAGGFSIGGTVYVMYGNPDTGNRTDGYVVDSWSSFATSPGTFTTNPASASIDSSSVGWATGGIVSGTPSSQHSEYTQNAWSSRTGITTALHASAASPA